MFTRAFARTDVFVVSTVTPVVNRSIWPWSSFSSSFAFFVGDGLGVPFVTPFIRSSVRPVGGGMDMGAVAALVLWPVGFLPFLRDPGAILDARG